MPSSVISVPAWKYCSTVLDVSLFVLTAWTSNTANRLQTCVACNSTTVPLYTMKTPSYWYKDSHYEHETIEAKHNGHIHICGTLIFDNNRLLFIMGIPISIRRLLFGECRRSWIECMPCDNEATTNFIIVDRMAGLCYTSAMMLKLLIHVRYSGLFM